MATKGQMNEKTTAIRARLRKLGAWPPPAALGALAREFGVDPTWVSHQRAALRQSGELQNKRAKIAPIALPAASMARLALLAERRGETADRLAAKILACVVGVDDKTCILDAVLDENPGGEA